jgi:hypothetical protein
MKNESKIADIMQKETEYVAGPVKMNIVPETEVIGAINPQTDLSQESITGSEPVQEQSVDQDQDTTPEPTPTPGPEDQ